MAVLLAVALLAGCATPPRVVEVGAPSWTIGEAWTYGIHDGRGREQGWIRYTVERLEAVPEVTDRAWSVRTERFDHGDADHDGTPDEVVRQNLHFDVATLERVWNSCGRPGGFGQCKGSSNNELAFPLWPGKTWRSNSGGDAIVDYRHTVHDDDAGRLVVSRFTLHAGAPHLVDAYDPALGFYAERRFWGGGSSLSEGPSEVWTLRDHAVLAP